MPIKRKPIEAFDDVPRRRRSISLPQTLWNALDCDAERCRRTPAKQLDELLTLYFAAASKADEGVIEEPAPIKSDLCDLLEAVYHHDDCPEWLREEFFDMTNRANVEPGTAEWWRAELPLITPYFERIHGLADHNSTESGEDEWPDNIIEFPS